VTAGLTLFLPHSSSFSDWLAFLMTCLTQRNPSCGYNESIVQDNQHAKPDLPVMACEGTCNPIAVHVICIFNYLLFENWTPITIYICQFHMIRAWGTFQPPSHHLFLLSFLSIITAGSGLLDLSVTFIENRPTQMWHIHRIKLADFQTSIQKCLSAFSWDRAWFILSSLKMGLGCHLKYFKG